ncbi:MULTISPECIES: DUF4166 domain-containing protein [unclassified Janthinobacterium]|uniref:DUF4166 domain-containing protein n=1 Tax=unclassified Janthinobacterium TaxID=2610881 RepID=UPI0003461588|nr:MULTISPECIES: DUF4166 domain-containing protein [unclassified Janthinobacterium]MEC5159736.1 hypothetical protein [Janthinobacterium sp. CG_S6]
MSGAAAPRTAGPSEGELFKRILGAEWGKLHPDIQRRFGKNPAPGLPLYYRGELSELRSSRIAKLLGYLSMPLIQGALIPYDDAHFPVDIQVYSKPGCAFIFKQRIYRLTRRKAIRFTSYMRESEKGEVLEYVGMGLGMKLLLAVRDGNLHFTSDGYFWDILGWRMPLPAILTPGTTFLRHCNDNPQQFNIRIDIEHCLFGRTFTQVGVFREMPDAQHEQDAA